VLTLENFKESQQESTKEKYKTKWSDLSNIKLDMHLWNRFWTQIERKEAGKRQTSWDLGYFVW